MGLPGAQSVIRLLQLSLDCRLLGSPGHQGIAALPLNDPRASCQVLLVALVPFASLVMPIQAAPLQPSASTPAGSVSCASAPRFILSAHVR